MILDILPGMNSDSSPRVLGKTNRFKRVRFPEITKYDWSDGTSCF